MSGTPSVSGSLSAQLNVTPLIDVLLVLLIIFMVITPSPIRGLHAEAPKPSSAVNVPFQEVAIRVEVLAAHGSSSQPVFRVDGHAVDLAAFRSELLRLHALHPFAPVFLCGDPSVSYEWIAKAIGDTRAAGFASVGLLPRL